MIRACRAHLCLVVVTLAVSCTTTTDLGNTCKMTRAGDGPCDTHVLTTCTRPIDPKDVSETTLNYLSLGAADCEDLVCLRSANTENPDNDIQHGVAYGYCSRGCIDDSDCSPDVAGKTGTLHCQRLMFSQEYLKQLQKDDPTTFEKIFGTVSPGSALPATSYCVKPAKT